MSESRIVQRTHGSTRHSLAWYHFHSFVPVRSCPDWFFTIRVFAIFLSSALSHGTSLGVPKTIKHKRPTTTVKPPRKYDM